MNRRSIKPEPPPHEEDCACEWCRPKPVETPVQKAERIGRETAELVRCDHPEETVLRSDEVTVERVSLALTKGPVIIAVTDEQARQIMEHHNKDAFLSRD